MKKKEKTRNDGFAFFVNSSGNKARHVKLKSNQNKTNQTNNQKQQNNETETIHDACSTDGAGHERNGAE